MQFEITLTLIVDAPSSCDAFDLGIGAAEHLAETSRVFPLVIPPHECGRVEVHPVVTA
jgi:hypothetical protein